MSLLQMIFTESLGYKHPIKIHTSQLSLILSNVAAIYWNRLFTPATYCLRGGDYKLQLGISHVVL